MLQYARTHGLTRDFMDEHPMLSRLIPPTPDTWQIDLQDLQDLPSLSNAVPATLKSTIERERWPTDRNTVDFLASVVGLSSENGETADQTRRWKSLRFDPPLLLTDPAADMERFYRRNTVTLSSRDFSRFPVDVEADESFEWPSSLRELSGRFEQTVQNVKLEIGQDVIRYLQEIVSPPYSELSTAAFCAKVRWYRSLEMDCH